ncbi:MAG: N-6 DNA methylase [Phycisphaeraceae bacterium]|nr:N-6 DNA methylase [Phycisphaeraceae bacterium]
MPSLTVTSATLRDRIKGCGYTGDRLAEGYSFGQMSLALGGFIGKPWDARSACLAVVDATTSSRDAAEGCRAFGAPTAIVCRGDSFDWWEIAASGPREPKTYRASEVEGFFRTHGAQLRPEHIYAAKLRRPVPAGVQMQFVDVGLLPRLERHAGEQLNRLVTQAIRSLMDELGSKVRSASDREGVYKSVFWMLAAKLLKEKDVRDFKSIDLHDTTEVFRVVGEHYKEARDYPPGDRTWKPALARVASIFAQWGGLGNITAESLAFLYEASLIDAPNSKAGKSRASGPMDVRKTLGIHSTPSILVDHILSQVWPLVDTDKLADQRVFEPACGHGAFLTAALRDLRNFSGMDDSAARHRFLRGRIRGVEFDAFAVEIAKLSLTLADVPHGNTWQIHTGDMFKPGVLREAANWATIVLSNPPYESFKKTGANRWLKSDEPVNAQTKAVEMLERVVPNLAPGAVFGFVLPQGVLFQREAKDLRKKLLESCEVAEISLFEDKLWNNAKPETCILLGRRKQGKDRVSTVMYRRVRNADMDAFKSSLEFSREDRLKPSELGRSEDVSLFEPDLREMWAFVDEMPKLGASFEVQQGFQLKARESLGTRNVVSKSAKAGYSKAVLNASDDYTVWEMPKTEWVDLRAANVRRPGAATVLGTPQVILNYAGPVQAWRFRPVVDYDGIAASSRFLTFRPNATSKHSLTTLWAVLLSPVAGAYAYSWSSKRQTQVNEWQEFPLPAPTTAQKGEIEAAAATYLKLAVPPRAFTLTPRDEPAIKRALLDLDAAVLRLYNLPPTLERQLLDIFDGVERPGVGCTFRGYSFGWSSRPAAPSLELPDDDRPIWERIAELAERLPEEVVSLMPTDAASQLDHYLYGAPKTPR